MKRLNVKLALWLVGIVIFSVVGVHFLHGYQIGRNAEYLKLQAERAKEDGENAEAIKLYNQYLKHRDDAEGYSVLAKLVYDDATESKANRQTQQRAYNNLAEAVRRHPELKDVRRRMIDFTMQVGAFQDALENIKTLIEQGEKDVDLDLKMAKCYFNSREEEQAIKTLCKVIGYDPATDQFSSDPAPGAHEVDAYDFLSTILLRKPDGTQKCAKIMAQLVALNPESAAAHLVRGRILINAAAQLPVATEEERQTRAKEEAEAKSELERALELGPENADVLLASATYSIFNKDYVQAQKLLDKALEKHPERQDIYLALADLKRREGDIQKGAEYLRLGLKQAKESRLILDALIDFQLEAGDLKAARDTHKEMTDRGVLSPELLRFHEARIKFTEANYLDAARDFEAVRPAIARIPRSVYGPQLNIMLGNCYQQLGQWDRVLEIYREVLRSYPDNLQARLGEAVALQNLGRHDEAGVSIDALGLGVDQFPGLAMKLYQLLASAQLQKPKEQRNWSKVTAMAEIAAKDPNRNELDNLLMKADLLMFQEQSTEAVNLLVAAAKKYPKDVRCWTSLARAVSRTDNAKKQLPAVLNRAEKEVGDIMALRLMRIREIMLQGGDDVAGNLKKLETGLDKFNENERLALMYQLGAAYMQASDYADAKRCWQTVAGKEAKNGQLQQLLFELAVDNADEPGMADVVKSLRDSKEFGPANPLTKYCAAWAMLSHVRIRQHENQSQPMTAEDRKSLGDARRLLEEALLTRPEWHALWRLKGEIEQQEGDVNNAIASYQKAIEFNRSGQASIAQQLVQLLYAQKRFAEATEALKLAGDFAASDNGQRIIQDILFKDGQIDKSLKLAQAAVEKDPKNAMKQLWYGRQLEKSGNSDDAEAAYRSAVAADPKLLDGWELYIRRLMGNRKKAEAAEAVREAAKSFDKEPAALARLYERAADNEHAEDLYKQDLEKHPNDLLQLRHMIEFYFNTQQMEKAVPYLDHVMELCTKSSDPNDQKMLMVARRFKAQALASRGDYEHLLEATKLVEKNRTNGQLSQEDIRSVVILLANRPEPESRAIAVQMLESLKKQRALQTGEELMLGTLYERAGKWNEGRDLILSAITKNTEDLNSIFTFSQMLIRHDEFDDAERWVTRMEELINSGKVTASAATKQSVGVLRARLLVHKGEKDQAVQLLEGFLPRPMAQSQLPQLEGVARLLEDLELYDAAEKLLAQYVSQEPRGLLSMAGFVARRGQVDKAFTLLEQCRKSEPLTRILPAALAALRIQPEAASKERFDMLEQWTTEALQNEANTQELKLLQAELFDLEGRAGEAIKLYREALADPKMSPLQKAIVQNNLAFVLSLTKQSPAEAVSLTNEAIRIVGPRSDLLDTRALAYLADGKVDQALADLQVAAADGPTPTKYFHLAQAEKQANHLQAARDAMAKANELGGIKLGQLSPTERKFYSQLAEELK